ncbi:hypothetical protein DFP72DRAFT_847364 [Ephemerocybe angulata]|uniref:Uncharacterized protein n=1 Tax=Ephemerocybe angulata TaxID=980116 RepID=A0A8H6HYV7_9AGAR|nr:hypothetical protein DFP72DRAFT_847364 [Tulosesus angulatus]
MAQYLEIHAMLSEDNNSGTEPSRHMRGIYATRDTKEATETNELASFPNIRLGDGDTLRIPRNDIFIRVDTHIPKMAEHNTWTVRKNLHYLGTQSPSTNLVLKKGDPRSYWLHVFPERNLDPWKAILDTLNGTHIPTCNPLQDSQKIAVAATNNARAALHQAETVIAALGEGNGLAEAKNFVDAHFYMLLECWNDILKWLLYLMLNTPTASDPLTIFTTVRTFYSMISFDGWSHLQEEILDNANTIDYIYLLLHQKDPESGMYWYINCAAGNPTCVILKSLSQCLNWESTTHLLASRFKAMRSGLRMKVVKSLYDRPRMMTFGGARGHDLWDFAIVAYDLATLSLVVSALGNDPEISKKIRRRVCYYIAYAMFVLASDEVEPFANFIPETWRIVVGGIARLIDGHEGWLTETNHVTPHSHRRILDLVRGKAVSTAFKCLARLLSGGGGGDIFLAESVLRYFLIHMTVSDVYRAVLRDLNEQADVLGRYLKEVGQRSSIALQFKRVLELSRSVFDEKPSLEHSLCANHETDKVILTYGNVATASVSRIALTDAGRKIGPDSGPSYSDVSRSVRQDQLKFLEHTVNASSGQLKVHADRPTHVLIDFRRQLFASQRMDISDRLYVNPHPQDEMRCSGAFENRVARYSEDAMAEPEKYVCAEAIFAYDWNWSTHVFAKLQYYPDASEGKRYRLLNSVFVFQCQYEEAMKF